MNDLISREKAIAQIRKHKSRQILSGGLMTYVVFLDDAVESLKNLQPERKKAHWIDTGSGQECSACHEIQCGHDSFRFFCAHCGADMRGDQK